MLGKIWRSLAGLFQRLFGLVTPAQFKLNRSALTSSRRIRRAQRVGASEEDFSSNAGGKTSRPLCDTDFEYVFMQLLEGVAHGWSQGRILRFFEGLKERATEAEWILWLRRFGENVLASPASNHMLAARIVLLGKQTQTIPSIHKIGEVASEIGAQLLAHEHNRAVWENEQPHAESTSSLFNQEEQQAADIYVISAIDQFLAQIPQAANLVQPSDQPLQIDPMTPQITTEAPIHQPDPDEQSASNQADLWLKQGVQLYEAGDLLAAIASFDKVIAIKPDFYQAWNNRGIAFSNLGAWEVAIASFDKAIEIKPDFYQAWNNQGAALFNLRRQEEALTSFNHATAIKLDFHEAWYNQGVTLFNLGYLQEAIASYDKAIAIQPNKHEAWNNRGYVLQKLRKWDEALDSYDKAIAIQPDFHEAWENRGYVLQQLGRRHEAFDSYEKARKIKPD